LLADLRAMLLIRWREEGCDSIGIGNTLALGGVRSAALEGGGGWSGACP
jgi:hypothetical protein